MPNKIAHESGLNQLFIYRYQLNKKFVHLGMNKEKGKSWFTRKTINQSLLTLGIILSTFILIYQSMNWLQ